MSIYSIRVLGSPNFTVQNETCEYDIKGVVKYLISIIVAKYLINLPWVNVLTL